MSFPSPAAYPPSVPGVPNNALVPGDAPIQPPQAFVDAAIVSYPWTNGLITVTPGLFTGTGGQPFEIKNDTISTSISFPILAHTGANGSFQIHNNSALSSLIFGALTEVDGGDLIINDNPLLTSIDLSHVLSVTNGAVLSIYSCTSIVSLGINSISSIDSSILVHDNSGLTSLSLSALSSIPSVGDLQIRDNDLLSEITLSSLSSIGGALECFGNNSLTSLNLSSLATISTGAVLQIYNNPNLVSINLSGLTVIADGADIEFEGNKFSSSQINAILAIVVASGAQNGILLLTGTDMAAPTGQGVTDAATLTNDRGWDCETN